MHILLLARCLCSGSDCLPLLVLIWKQDILVVQISLVPGDVCNAYVSLSAWRQWHTVPSDAR